MGGRSRGGIRLEPVAGQLSLLLAGELSLDQGGGFIQVNADLAAGEDFDASRYRGISFELFGDGGSYTALLKTSELERPWQSYRATVSVPAAWMTWEVLFAGDKSAGPSDGRQRAVISPHRTDRPFDPRRLRRVGLGALGRSGPVRLALGGARWLPR